jgi:hypothetical protein
MTTFTRLLCPDRPVDLPVVMLPGLPEHKYVSTAALQPGSAGWLGK